MGNAQTKDAFLTEDDIERLENGSPKEIRKKILQLAGPTLTEMILVNFVQMLNMVLVGRVGAEAVTAVGLTNQPVFLALAAFVALNVGTTAIVARAIGSGDIAEANHAASQTFLLNVGLSIILSVLGYLLSEPMLVFMGAEAEVLKEGVLYTQITFLSLGFVTTGMSLSAILRGAGDTVTPMRINVLSNILIVPIGFTLIYGYFGFPEMGVAGAAVATAITRVIATGLLIYMVFTGRSIISLHFRDLWKLDMDVIKRIIHIGLPAAGEQFVLRGGQIIFAMIVAGLGTVTFAANQISFTILGLTFMPGLAFSAAATTLVGQGLGANKPDLAERFGWETRKIGSMLATTIGLFFILFPQYIMMPFTNQAEVIEQGVIALRVVGFIQIAQSTQFILAGALRGAGDTRFPLYSMIVGVWGFRVVLSILLVLVFDLGILGAWLAIAVDQIARSVIIVRRYKNGKWKTLQV